MSEFDSDSRNSESFYTESTSSENINTQNSNSEKNINTQNSNNESFYTESTTSHSGNYTFTENSEYDSQYQFDENNSEYLGFAITSLVTGICSLVCCCSGLNSILSILGIVFGAIYLSKGFKKGKGMAIAGIVCSAISLLLVVVLLILGLLGGVISAIPSYFDTIYDTIL